jgi:hypothetical protein
LIALAPVACYSQDAAKSPIPLDHFYVKRHGSNIIRKALANFHFGLYTGLGNTYLSNTLNGYGIYQAPNSMPQLFTDPAAATRFTNWVTDPGQDVTAPGNYIVATPGTANLGFKGNAFNIPLALTVHYQIKNIRVGGGYSYEMMSIGSLHPISLADKISNFTPDRSTGFGSRYWIMGGYSFYQWNDYLFTGELQLGSFSLPSNYNTSVAKTSAFINLGVKIERPLSEYFRVYLRPAYEIKSYDLQIPGSGTIPYSMNALYLTVGFTYSIPELPRCFLNECHAQINHHHGNKEYRSRRHPIYKKQNPGYGENDPVLIKYKGKNKRKINPY